MLTDAPAAASPIAIARPIPLSPPVTTATLSASLPVALIRYSFPISDLQLPRGNEARGVAAIEVGVRPIEGYADFAAPGADLRQVDAAPREPAEDAIHRDGTELRRPVIAPERD